MRVDEREGYNGACIRYNFTSSSGVNPPLRNGGIFAVWGELVAPEEVFFVLVELVGSDVDDDAEAGVWPSPCPPCMRVCIIRKSGVL